MNIKRTFLQKNQNLLLIALSLSILSLGFSFLNSSPSQLAKAQSNPTTPGGGTVVIPGQVQPTTSGTATTGTTGTPPTSGTSTSDVGVCVIGVNSPCNGNATSTSTSTSTSQTSPQNPVSTAPVVKAPASPSVQTESVVDGTAQTVSNQGQAQSLNTQSTADTTVRSGGLEFTVAGVVIVGLAAWYYYYHNNDPKKSLKMSEKKIKKS